MHRSTSRIAAPAQAGGRRGLPVYRLAVSIVALLPLAAAGCVSDRQREACGYGCAADCVGYPDAMCFGYYPTCWRPWPAECPGCEVLAPMPAGPVEMVPLPSIDETIDGDEPPFPPLPDIDPMDDPVRQDASPADEPPMDPDGEPSDDEAMRRNVFQSIAGPGRAAWIESDGLEQGYQRYSAER